MKLRLDGIKKALGKQPLHSSIDETRITIYSPITLDAQVSSTNGGSHCNIEVSFIVPANETFQWMSSAHANTCKPIDIKLTHSTYHILDAFITSVQGWPDPSFSAYTITITLEARSWSVGFN